jgi:hypothetical protein
VWNPTATIRTDGPIGFADEDEDLDALLLLAPIAGGCEPAFIPSPDDWAAYHAMCETADYLDGFNRVRDDA